MPRPIQPRRERLRPKSQGVVSSGQNFRLTPWMCLNGRIQALDEAIPARIAFLLKEVYHTQDRLQAILEAEQEQQTPTKAFSRADQHAVSLVQTRFGNRKQVKHLQAFFALLWRRRLAPGRVAW
jgi:hypothetical protein